MLDAGGSRACGVFGHLCCSLQIDFQLYLEIKDRDGFDTDDHIDDIVIRISLNTSSVFTAAMVFSGNRISLSLRFRVHCIGGYMGPYCDCLPHNDSINGHYQCEADGSISCHPGYTNTTGFCTQGKCSVLEK